MDETLREIIQMLKELSPPVWKAALVQVHVKAWLNFGLAGLFLLVSGIFFYWGIRLAKTVKWNDDDAEVGGVIAIFVVAVFLLVPFLGNLYYGLLYLFSPDWAAIQLILEQLK